MSNKQSASTARNKQQINKTDEQAI